MIGVTIAAILAPTQGTGTGGQLYSLRTKRVFGEEDFEVGKRYLLTVRNELCGPRVACQIEGVLEEIDPHEARLVFRTHMDRYLRSGSQSTSLWLEDTPRA